MDGHATPQLAANAQWENLQNLHICSPMGGNDQHFCLRSSEQELNGFNHMMSF
jgi:hypothetical protein